MDVAEEYYKLYIAITRRLRWTLSTTIIVSALMFIHVYVEQFSYESAQMTAYIKNEITSRGDSLIAQYRRHLYDTNTNRETPGFIDSCDKYAQWMLSKAMTTNSLSRIDYGRPSLPILNTTIPGPDYIPILAIFIAIFDGALLITYRSLAGTVRGILQQDHLGMSPSSIKDLIRLNLAVAVKLDGMDEIIAPVIQYGAILVPMLLMYTAIYFDLAPIREYLVGSKLIIPDLRTVVLRVAIIFSCMSIVMGVTISLARNTHTINRLLNTRRNLY